jgi:hypothetical protein
MLVLCVDLSASPWIKKKNCPVNVKLITQTTPKEIIQERPNVLVEGVILMARI